MSWKLRVLCVFAGIFSLFMIACTNVAADNIDNHGGVGGYIESIDWNVWNHYFSLSTSQPVPYGSLNYSNERQNIIRRTQTWSDPNKRGFIYLLNNDGSVEAFYSIKGKVSALDSGLTPNLGCEQNSTTGSDCAVVDLPQPDGSFGTNGSGIYFYTASGTYVEWNGKYLLSDRPLQLSQQPKLIVTVSGDSGP